jgi:sec-independent protein translocase protein TatB
MFGVSITELIVIFLVALVLFGPDQLPHMARQLGKLMGDLKKGSDSVRREFYNTVYPPAQEIRRDLSASARDLRQLRSEVLAPSSEAAPNVSGLAPSSPAAESVSTSEPYCNQATMTEGSDVTRPPEKDDSN